MTQLTINSVPMGAEVKIDGEVAGTTPLTIPIGEGISLEEFRAECMSDGVVVCSWYILENRLEDQTVSRLWWDLTQGERHSVAERAVKNTLYYDVRWSCTGLPMCAGAGGDWVNACCVQDTMVRYLKFISKSVQGADSCYHKHHETSDVLCYVPEISYNLPGAWASCATPYGPGYGHAMCAIQIGTDIMVMDSWVVFQYTNFDIQPGDWQMPTYKWDDLYLRMLHLDEILPGCTGHDATEFVRWDL